MNQKKYTINDLPKFSDWPAKLLGLQESKQYQKNNKNLDREYDKEKWKSLLDKALVLKKKVTLKEVEETYFGNNDCLSFNQGQFQALKLIVAQKKYQKLISDFLIKNTKNYSSIAELGCGYGSIILDLAKRKEFKDKNFLAADFSENGCKLTKFISESENIDLDVFHCDFTNKAIVNKKMDKDTLILTSYAIACIPHLPVNFIDSFIAMKPKLVVHFEPIYEHTDTETLFGQLRKRYTEVNDYNQNLLTRLKDAEKSKKIKIVKIEKNLFGPNPLLPVSAIIWKPIY